MPIDSEQFLEVYAKALNTFEPKKIASFCLPPTVIMDDYGKKVMNSELELQAAFEGMFDKLKQAGISKFVPELHQTMRLSDTLFFSKMRWQFFNQQDQLQFSCATSYTLQRMPDKQLKIIVAVIDDDEHQLATIFTPSE
jgi:hypothetical protein